MTTNRLVASLDVIRYELDRMNIAISDATHLARNDRSTIRRAVGHLTRSTEKLLDWLFEKRLEMKN